MAIKLLFEDNENSPSSILLKHSMHGDSIYFSGGVTQLLSKLKSIYTAQDTVFVMHDMSPNNRWTIKFYDGFVQEIKSNQQKYNGVYIVPIVCIEYYLCKFLNKYGYLYIKNSELSELVKAIVDEPFDYSRVPSNILNITKLRNSLEKMYKYIVKNQAMICMHNNFEYDKVTGLRINTLSGIFYDRDCSCKDIYCRIQSKDNLEIKAERLYSLLPVFAISSAELLNQPGIDTENMDIQTIQNEMQRVYNEICRSMGINTIKIFASEQA